LVCVGSSFAQEAARPKTWGTTRVMESATLASEFAPRDSGVGWRFQESAT
jgi:hypothetical protein